MGLPLFKEKRFSPRKKLTGLMPGKLSVSDSDQPLSCRPVDVSRNGLGIIMDAQLKVSTELRLDAGDKSIILKVAWSQPDFGRRDLFRYGLVCLDSNEDLESLFTKKGCLV